MDKEISTRDMETEQFDDEIVFDDYENTPDDSPPTAEESMRYYGVDFDVSGLVRRLNQEDLVIPSFDPSYSEAKGGIEGFQRRFVWPKKQMDRFIESLLLGYPVPGIFLLERPNRKFLVLDGQQRLRTLQGFYNGIYEISGGKGKEAIFALENVGEHFRGKTYKNLSEADRRLLDSTILQSTIVVPKEDNLEAVYLVFERINSSGIKLQPQEIRVALYSGELISLLRILNSVDFWRTLFGPPHQRLKDHELILRYLLLTESAEVFASHGWDKDAARSDTANADNIYRSGMASSLNRYLSRHRNLEGIDSEQVTREFTASTELLSQGIGKSALRPRGNQINAAHTDALLVGITLALRKGVKLTPESVKKVNDKLLADKSYMKSILESTAHLESVVTRLEMSERLFSEVA
jgi:hypothetical protein